MFNKLKYGIPPEDIDSYDPSLVSSPPAAHPSGFPTYHGTLQYDKTNAAPYSPPQALRRITSYDPNLGAHDPTSPGMSSQSVTLIM